MLIGPDTTTRLNAQVGPDFLCIGTLKAGTTWLFRNLRQHPKVWLPPVKEISYFNYHFSSPLHGGTRLRKSRKEAALRRTQLLGVRQDLNDFQKRDLDCLEQILRDPVDDSWYCGLFAQRGSVRIAGDISPHYALLPDEAIEQAMRLSPKLKAVALVRDPAQRALSHMAMHAAEKSGGDQDTLLKAIRRIFDGPHWGFYAAHSHYSAWLGRWRRAVGAENLHVETLERIEEEPNIALGRLCRFLGIPGSAQLFPEAERRVNAARYSPEDISILMPEIRERLGEAYSEFRAGWPELARYHAPR